MVITFLTIGFAQKPANDRGFFNISNYSPKEYMSAPQNWSMVQDKRGVMYFANNNCVLEYDGENWNIIPGTNNNNIRSLAIDSRGTVYVGGLGDFGLLKPDSSGKQRYHSLLNYLPVGDREFAEVWKTYVTPNDEVYFQTGKKIFRWNGKYIKTWNAQKGFHQMFMVNGVIYVTQSEIGLMTFVDSSLVLAQGGEVFADEKVYFMVPYKKNQILLNTRKRSLYTMQPTSPGYFPSDRKNPTETIKLKPFETSFRNFFVENQVYNGLRLGDNLFSIGTIGAGLMALDTAGNISASVNKSSGLQDATIYYQYTDADNKLWLALNNGISRVDINSPITRFNDKNGLESSVRSICRHRGIMYVASRLGVYKLVSGIGSNTNELLEHQVFSKIPDTDTECWDMLSMDTPNGPELLVATTGGLIQVNDKEKTTYVLDDISFSLRRSKKDSLRIFVGHENGISSIYYNNGKWIKEGRIPDVGELIRTIAEDDDGNLWLGLEDTGVIRVVFSTSTDHKRPESEITRFTPKHGLPEESVFVRNINGRMVFGTKDGLYKFVPSSGGTGAFIPDTLFSGSFKNTPHVIVVEPDQNGRIWMETVVNDQFSLGYLHKENNIYKWNDVPFMGISSEIIYTIYHDNNGITWLGGSEGLYRFDNNIQKDYSREFFSLVRKVTTGKDSVIFYGTFRNSDGTVASTQPETQKLTLPYALNSLTFHFSATSFENEASTVYSYKLEGFDSQWTDWKKETKAVYTNLHEGTYYFKVKAKNVFGRESKEAVYEFTIASPWYRTIWAYLGYILSLGALVYGAVVFSTRSLRTIIDERTAEVVAQKEVIELKNKDITDSINYAKRIQQAILPTLEYFKSLLPDSFVLYKPKDIVSGDFYWISERDGKVLVAAADCTGHGVPGALTSMIGNSLLNEIVNEKGVTKPSEILDLLKQGIIKSLKQTGAEGENKDGMDIALCAIDMKTKELQYAGAYNPLIIVRNGEVIELKADKCPIAISERNIHFTNNELKCEPGDTVYLFSDGYADQFGGPEGKKLMRKKMKDIILNVQNLEMPNQGRFLNSSLMEWQGSYAQVDDILVIGIRL